MDYVLWATGTPIPYEHTSFGEVSALFGATALLTGLGFWCATHVNKRISLQDTAASRRWPFVGLALSVVLVVPTIGLYSGFGLNQLGTALSNQAAAYAAGTQQIEEGTASRLWFVILQTLCEPLVMAAVPFFAARWFQYRQYGLWMILAFLAPLSVTAFVARDVQAGLAVTVALGAWVVVKGRENSREVRPFRSLILCALAIAAAVGFGARKIARSGGVVPYCQPGVAQCNPDEGSSLMGSVKSFASYAAQGLEGLGHALQGSWHFGGGLSHARALTQFLGIDTSHTVTGQLDAHGWNSLGNWSTALTAFANDVPWILVPVVLFVLGCVLGSTWRDALETEHWLPLTAFAHTFSLLFLVPQNFVVGASGPLYLAYLFVLAIYFWMRGASRSSR